MNEKKAVLLLSGGIDSATTGAFAKSNGFELYALSFDYGQRHKAELQAATKIAKWLDVTEHLVLPVPLDTIGGSALTDAIDLPKDGDQKRIGTEIPVTYVPARNLIFLSYAVAWAEVLKAGAIYIGANAVDYSGYPDCRPEFIKSFETTANLATKVGAEGHGVIVKTPLMKLSKAEIIVLGTKLKLDYSMTVSCYDADESGLACGECDSCVIRRKGFENAGVPDCTRYVDSGGRSQ